MKVSIVKFVAKENAALLTYEEQEELDPNQVLIKSHYSAISAGTELANYHQLPNTGTGSNPNKNPYPFGPGYSAVGEVVKVGSEVEDLKPGDIAGVIWNGHRSWYRVARDKVFKVPEGIDEREAAFLNIATFSLLGVRKLHIQLGEPVMIAGQGLLGMLAGQFARLSGACPVLVSDFSPERRALALKLGADYAFDPREADFIQKVKDVTDGKGPAAVVEVTGYISALKQALEYIDWMGRITLLGCTRISDETIDYYKYVHRRGVEIYGCHTETRPKQDSHPGYWTQKDDICTFFKFLQRKKVQVLPMISEVVSANTCHETYDRIGSSKNPPLGFVFDWTNIDA
ncbi:MAG: zinc-binding alcohol dehydrogenase [Victivallales bacterium]|nr:zinc-binding alcohol dehydrogenase [Victivallales bacterium]